MGECEGTSKAGIKAGISLRSQPGWTCPQDGQQLQPSALVDEPREWRFRSSACPKSSCVAGEKNKTKQQQKTKERKKKKEMNECFLFPPPPPSRPARRGHGHMRRYRRASAAKCPRTDRESATKGCGEKFRNGMEKKNNQ